MDREWISLHIFHHGDLDLLLREGVRRLVAGMLERREADQYFFVRYWNGGPHIRLRILPPSDVDSFGLATTVSHQLTEYLATLRSGPADSEAYRKQAAFVREFRSQFAGAWAIGQAHIDIEEPFQESDTVQLREYEFDYARYGGKHARQLTEEHFFTSSKLALTILHNNIDNRGKLHAWALMLMTTAIDALGICPEEASRLLGKYLNCCNLIFDVSAENFSEKLGFHTFESQRDQVIEIIRGLEPNSQNNRALARWRNHLSECVAHLNDLQARDLLSVPVTDLVMDYVHMLNNRLGIPLPEDLYLAGLLANGYSAIEKES